MCVNMFLFKDVKPVKLWFLSSMLALEVIEKQSDPKTQKERGCKSRNNNGKTAQPIKPLLQSVTNNNKGDS